MRLVSLRFLGAVIEAYGVAQPWDVSQVPFECMLRIANFMIRLIMCHDSPGPLPEAPIIAWSRVSTIAMRVLVTQHWLNAPVKMEKYIWSREDPADETEIDLYIELKKLLAWVASALLTEAVLDKRHDMQGIFRCGLEAVLGAWTRYDLVCAPLTRLGLAVLRRLAFDATLLSHPESMYKSSNDWVLESKGIQAAVYLLCE